MARPRVLTIADCHSAARKRGGKCISRKYEGKKPLTWQCSEGHQFEKSPYRVFAGNWCRECWKPARRKYTLEYFQRKASEQGGKCLSVSCSGLKDKLLWECENGHKWFAIGESVKNGSWCRKCTTAKLWDTAWVDRRIDLKDVQKRAKARGGRLISSTIQNGSTEKVLWVCQYGHQWSGTYDNFVAGAWCPVCRGSFGEELVRLILEQLFKKPFPRTKPRFLRSSSGFLLELDGYNEELRLAFEHHGEQHYRDIEYFTNSLREIQKRDDEKRELCKESQIRLIEVPAIGSRLDPKDASLFISEELSRLKIAHDRKSIVNIDLDATYFRFERPRFEVALNTSSKAPHSRVEKILILEEIAHRNKGTLISKRYFTAAFPYKFQCKRGHLFARSVSQLRTGLWCDQCGIELSKHTKTWLEQQLKIRIKERTERTQRLHQLAKINGGRFVGRNYEGADISYPFQCSKGHAFKKYYKDLISGEWCRICKLQGSRAEARLGIESLNKTAREKGGKCLSRTYTTVGDKYLWQCARGHKWHATAAHVRQGTWCPECYRTRIEFC